MHVRMCVHHFPAVVQHDLGRYRFQAFMLIVVRLHGDAVHFSAYIGRVFIVVSLHREGVHSCQFTPGRCSSLAACIRRVLIVVSLQ